MSITAHLTFGKSISLNPELKNPTRLAHHQADRRATSIFQLRIQTQMPMLMW